MKVFVEHRTLGKVAVEIDREDKNIFDENNVVIKQEFARDVNSYVVIPNYYTNGSQAYVARIILENHGLCYSHHKVHFNDGNSLNLKKKNLSMVEKPSSKKK
jgi:hypothetical protein